MASSPANKGVVNISQSENASTLQDVPATDGGITEFTKVPFFRSTLFQILVVGLCAFSAPGIWTALNGLGVGGSQSPQLVNAANAIAYAFMTVTCFAGPWATSLIGFRWTLALGTLGYPLYAAGLYVNNRFGTTWFVYVGAIACGTSAGFFWSVEGAIATGYPEAHKRGRYLATWFTFRNCGNLLGGSISLALNVDANYRGAVGAELYLVFIVLQCLGFFFALLLSNPDQVRRSDGTALPATPSIKLRDEGKEMWRLARSKSILLMIPLFWYFGWMQAYPGTYLEAYFTVRARALGSCLFGPVMSLATWLAGSLVDVAWHPSRKIRALTTYTFIVGVNSATWIWAVIIQNEYRFTNPVLDWADPRTFGRGFGLYMMELASLAVLENYNYWCISNLSDSPGDQIRYSSLLRGIETAGVAVGFGVQAVPTALIATASINTALWFIALPFGYLATIQVVRRFRQLEAAKLGAEPDADEDRRLVE